MLSTFAALLMSTATPPNRAEVLPNEKPFRYRAANGGALRENLLSFETTRMRDLGHDPHRVRYNPDFWTDEFAFLSRPGQAQIQSDLFYDYRINVSAPDTAANQIATLIGNF